MEQAVIIEFFYQKEELDDLHALDLTLHALIEQAAVGQYDFHEIDLDRNMVKLFMYGDNAETLFKTVLPELEKATIIRNGVATLRFGRLNPDTPMIEVPVNPVN